MKKKGFTLVELLVTIAILAILMGISLVAYNRIRDNVLNQELNNTISYIEAQARNYANDTNITVVSVEDLIKEGYVEPDDETDIYNPVTDESLNCYIVKSTYEEGKYTSVLDISGESNRNNDGTCSTYEKKSNLIIGVSEDGENYNPASNDKWYKEDVYLVGMQKESTENYNQITTEEGYEYKWESNIGTTKTTAKIKTETIAGVAINIPYKITINWEENDKSIKAEASATINIDKEPPIIEKIEEPDNSTWSRERNITLEATDKSGSGLKGIYICTKEEIEECKQILEECNQKIEECIGEKGYYQEVEKETKIEFKGITREGIYQAIAIDKVGNISEGSKEFEVANVDGTIDSISLTPNTTAYTKEDIILTGKAQDKGSGIIAYKFNQTGDPEDGSWNEITLTNEEISKTKTVSTNGIYYFCVKDELGNTKCASYEVKNIDKKYPSITLSKSTEDYVTSLSLTISALDESDNNNAASGLKRLAITTSSTAPASNSSLWKNISSTNNIIYNYTYNETITNNAKYYIYVEDNVGNITSKNISIENQIIVLTSKSFTNEYRNSSITTNEYISDIIKLKSVTVNDGSVSNVSLSGKYVNYKLSGGKENTGIEKGPCYLQAYTSWPNAYEYCTGVEGCYNGGVQNGKICTHYSSDYYSYRGYYYVAPGAGLEFTCDCINGKYLNCDEEGGSTPCRTGYSSSSSDWAVTGAGYSTFVSQTWPSIYNNQVGTCTTSYYKYFSTERYCYWDGDYSACSGRYETEYYCNYGTLVNGQTCYYCTQGTFNYNTKSCYYQYCDITYSYWKYVVTISYYKIK